MGSRTLIQYIGRLNTALQSQDGDTFASLIRIFKREESNVRDNRVLILENCDWPTIENNCHKLDEPFNEILILHFRVIEEIVAAGGAYQVEPDYSEAYLKLANLVSTFTRIYETLEGWANPIMITITTDLRLLGNMSDNLSDVARLLNKAFHVCQIDRGAWDVSRKAASLHVVNSLFRVYFHLKQHRLCHSLMRAINTNFPDIKMFPASQRVTFKYFVGLIAFYDEDFQKAEQEFMDALQHCHKDSRKNKRLILVYLTPIKLLRGKGVNSVLIQKYGLFQFAELIQSIKVGDVRTFNKTLEKNERYFVFQGIYLIVERLKLLLYRNLFKKTYIILGKNSKMPVNTFQTALKVGGEIMDIEEVECIIAVLIDKGCIKGYLSREKAFLVLSNANPFPVLETFI